MANIEYKDLLEAGVHFGHLTRKWDPRMAHYIFMEKNGIHIIDLNKTLVCLDDAFKAAANIARAGKKILFVATKKQAKETVAEQARRLKMPYVTERWLGGMLTNFVTIRKSLKRMQTLEKMTKEESYKGIAKRERLTLQREKDKLERVLGGIADMTRPPSALFVVDIVKEHIAVKEAQRLGIPVFALVDTNCNPYEADFPIPANDDSFKSIALLTKLFVDVMEEADQERKKEKADQKVAAEEQVKREVDTTEVATEE